MNTEYQTGYTCDVELTTFDAPYTGIIGLHKKGVIEVFLNVFNNDFLLIPFTRQKDFVVKEIASAVVEKT